MIGGTKVERVYKTKFRKKEDPVSDWKQPKQKHHDKSFYRLAKEESNEYHSSYPKANKRN